MNQKYITSSSAIKAVEGKILGTLDILNLEEKQEKALKAAIRQYVWSLGKVGVYDEKLLESVERQTMTYHPAEDIKSSEELGYD